MKKKLFIGVVVLCLLGLMFILRGHVLAYVYLNPLTNTSVLPNISKPIKELDKAFAYAKFSSARSGYNINYLYYNAYGSGFIRNNKIPNDLDFAVGIDLGEYEYNGKNSQEIAENIIDKMNSFESAFNFYINMSSGEIYSTISSLEYLSLLDKQKSTSVKNIADSLDDALFKKYYVKYTKKKFNEKEFDVVVDMPYIMRQGEVLVEDRRPIILFSDMVRYNSSMPSYMREISIIPEFYVNIKFQGKVYNLEIVPEAFIGNRLQLSRRFFAPMVFVNNTSANYLKHSLFLENDENYLSYRLLSYKRHLQEIDNILAMKDRPIKLFKRLMQTADMIYPVLPKEVYSEIADFVNVNLNNPNIKLLNEYTNICGNIFNIMGYPSLFFKLKENGKIKEMADILDYSITSLKNNGDIDENIIKILEDFKNKELMTVLEVNDNSELKQKQEYLFDKYSIVYKTITEAVLEQVNDLDKINKFTNIFNQIYSDSGFHRISLSWLDNNTLGIIEDDFTRGIKDFKHMADENELVDLNYKLIKPNEDLSFNVSYDVFVRYNSTEGENKNYKLLQDKLLNDKKNFSIKRKFVWY